MINTTQMQEGMVLHISLNRPKANILDAEMIGAICGALDNEVTAETRLIVFEGAGDHFSFGASVEEHQADQAADMLTSFHGMFRKLADLGVPTCAVVRGQCLGGGLELASWCSFVVCTPDAKLGQPEIQLAVFAPMASIILPWRAGGMAALDLCVSGRSISAEEAKNLGIVNAVTGDPTEWWQELVTKRLGRTSASSLRYAEKAARMDLVNALNETIPRLEKMYTNELMKTHDANEGIGAFLQRRKPTFKNH